MLKLGTELRRGIYSSVQALAGSAQEEAANAQKVLAKINVTNLPLIVQKLGAAYGYQKSQFI